RRVHTTRAVGWNPAARPSDLSVGQYAAALRALPDALDTSQVVVCAKSMGGYIIFELFRRAPKRIRAAILCSTKAPADSAEARREIGRASCREGAWMGAVSMEV